MNVALVGYGRDGAVSYEYFVGRGDQVTICDEAKLPVPDGAATQMGENYLDNLDRFDLIVRSSGIHPDIILAKNPGVADKITTSIDTFLQHCPTPHTFGVTGTKGKGTTSTLITKILEASGRRAFLGGNIGLSPLGFINQLQPDDWVVLELSSYQLHDITRSTHIAVCLKMEDEHLDWHGDVQRYHAAKSRLFANQSPDDAAIYYACSPAAQRIAQHSPAARTPYYEQPGAYIDSGENVVIDGHVICHTSELQLLGKHNWQNVCAAVTAVWQAGIRDLDAIRDTVTTFKGLEHRIEFVRSLDGVAYYNDSFATNTSATIAAVLAIPQPQVLIMGGHDRMLPLENFAKQLQEQSGKIRQVIAIGASGDRLAAVLREAGLSQITRSQASTMTEVIQAAQTEAKPGDAIVLSPGFASFGMFKDFIDRGEQFKQVVNEL
ncbi:UDP-N-acetylmuramoyl-L-alanine--D-glutamate ligase [Candidatus Saccharibacteria bacterium]|nr:MAG: UDP-N-acetylmuramoyl-L-alanine--D-glutamate ligase [Candidatus Saccharibacteria bacterium]